MAKGIQIEITVDEHGTVETVRRVERELHNLDSAGRQAASGVSRTESSLAGMKNLLVGGGVIYGLDRTRAAVWNLGKSFADTAGSFESLQISLDTITNGGGAAKLRELSDWARKMPGATEDAVQSFIMMRAMGLKPLIGDMTTLMDATSALGGGMDKFQGIALALGQIATKGELMSQEIRQLAERGIPAYEILNEKLGITGKDLEDAGRAAIDSNVAIKALLEGMNERFGGQSRRMQETFRGLVSTMVDDWRLGIDKMMNESGSFEAIKNEIRKIDEMIIKIGESEDARELIHDITTAVIKLTNGLISAGTWAVDHKDFLENVFASAAVLLAYQRIIMLAEGVVALTAAFKGLTGVRLASLLLGSNPVIGAGVLAAGGAAVAGYSGYKLVSELGNGNDGDIRASMYRNPNHPLYEAPGATGTIAGVNSAQKIFNLLGGTVGDARKYDPFNLYEPPVPRTWRDKLLGDKLASGAGDGLSKQDKTSALDFIFGGRSDMAALSSLRGSAVALGSFTSPGLKKFNLGAEFAPGRTPEEEREYREKLTELQREYNETSLALTMEGTELEKELLKSRFETEYGMYEENDERRIAAEQVLQNKLGLIDREASEARTREQAESWMRLADTISVTMMHAMTTSGNAFQNIADGFKNMLESMAAQWASKAAIFGLLQMLAPAGVVSKMPSFTNFVFGFEGGGYTGPGNRKGVAGLVHYDEYVINSKTLDQYGVGFFDRLSSGGTVYKNSNNTTNQTSTANLYLNGNRTQGGDREFIETFRRVVRENPALRREILRAV